MDDYEKQAKDFLKKTNTEFNAKFLRHGKHFVDDKETRDIYEITLKRGEREFKFNFGQSINASGEYIVYSGEGKLLVQGNQVNKYRPKGLQISKNKDFKAPTPYDVLAGLQKGDVGTFNDFCGDFGYDIDSRKAEKTYKAVVEEYKNVCMLWTEKELEELQEVQ